MASTWVVGQPVIVHSLWLGRILQQSCPPVRLPKWTFEAQLCVMLGQDIPFQIVQKLVEQNQLAVLAAVAAPIEPCVQM